MARYTGTLEEGLQRLHKTGPEFDGWLSNHGPMMVEALDRHGHGASVHRWLDGYLKRLDELPRGLTPVREEEWSAALGDHRRIGDWIEYFGRAVRETPWRDVLALWWPRLLPGITASATHGAIRVGHAVHALLGGETPERLTELAHALGYWAARFAPAGVEVLPSGSLTAAEAIRNLPRIPQQVGSIRQRLRQLPAVPSWVDEAATLRPAHSVADVPRWLGEVVAATTSAYLSYERSGNIMLIHGTTAPNAVLRTLPALPQGLWLASLRAAWTASAAVVSMYAASDVPPEVAAETAFSSREIESPDEVFARAVEHGDEHVVKFADTAVDVFARDGDRIALASVLHAVATVPP